MFVFEIIKQKEMSAPEFLCYVYLFIFDTGSTKKNARISGTSTLGTGTGRGVSVLFAEFYLSMKSFFFTYKWTSC
jgi:hypothetical protein